MEAILNKDRLSQVNNYDEFSKICLEFSRIDNSMLFDFLFPLAIGGNVGGISDVAGKVLIEIEPKHTRPCKELLHEVACSSWEASNKEVPFYFVSQFGKWNLIDEYNVYLQESEITQTQKRRVEGVVYWASSPTAKLALDLHYWELQDDEDNV